MAGVFKIVLEVSISAGVISLMALGARLLMGRRSSVLLPLLTALIIVRLAIPFSISSPLSVQNLLPRIELPAGAESVSPEKITLQSPADTGAKNASVQSIVPAKEAITGETDAAMQAIDICTVVWLCGIAALAAFIAVGNARFAWRIRRNRKYDAPGFEELLLRCRAVMGLQREVEAVQMSEINTAAVYGTLRPKLLISPSFAWLSEEEKRHVLLHELAHIKRKDTLFSLLITALNIVYWFNPLVWAALALARRDIEVMCDMTVLKKTEDRKGYAKTLLELAKVAPPNRPRLAAALFVSPQRFGVLISTNSIKRRIKMISGYKKNPVMTALALILTVAIAVTGCTGAVLPSSPSAAGAGDTSGQEGRKLVAQYTLDISELPKDEARQANIEKAAAMLDGIMIPATEMQAKDDGNTWLDLKSKLGGITEEAGWRNAPATGPGFLAKALGTTIVYTASDGKSQKTIESEDLGGLDTDPTVGGGMELVTFAVLKAASDLGMDTFYFTSETEFETAQSNTVYICSSFGSDDIDKDIEGYTEGSTGVLNTSYPQDVFVKIEVSKERITASLYSELKTN